MWCMATNLTSGQIDLYHANGYLLGLPAIYSREQMDQLNADLPNLLALLQPGETAKDIREWHETSTYLYDIVMNPRIHDLVEGILGPNFYLLGKQLFHQGAIQFVDRGLAPGRILLAYEAA